MLTDHYYGTLPPQEQYAYQTVKNALLRGDASCTLTDLNDRNAPKRIIEAVTMDHPEIVQYPGLFVAGTLEGRNANIPLQYCEVDWGAYDRRLNKLIETIDKSLSPTATEYAKCKAIYDALANRIKYDEAAFREYVQLQNNNASSNAITRFIAEKSSVFTPYGALMTHKGVCQGIAKLFKILCDRFGIQCACAGAVSNDSYQTAHLLNVVEIDGKRAFVDVTNGLKRDDLPIIMYDCFLVSNRLYSPFFIVSEDFNCVAEDINYFVKNKVWFTLRSELRNYLCAYTTASTGGVVRCRYDGKQMNQDELKEFFEDTLNRHCRRGYQLSSLVQHGFCTALINTPK